jgi:hypothetical protein
MTIFVKPWYYGVYEMDIFAKLADNRLCGCSRVVYNAPPSIRIQANSYEVSVFLPILSDNRLAGGW